MNFLLANLFVLLSICYAEISSSNSTNATQLDVSTPSSIIDNSTTISIENDLEAEVVNGSDVKSTSLVPTSKTVSALSNTTKALADLSNTTKTSNVSYVTNDLNVTADNSDTSENETSKVITTVQPHSTKSINTDATDNSTDISTLDNVSEIENSKPVSTVSTVNSQSTLIGNKSTTTIKPQENVFECTDGHVYKPTKERNISVENEKIFLYRDNVSNVQKTDSISIPDSVYSINSLVQTIDNLVLNYSKENQVNTSLRFHYFEKNGTICYVPSNDTIRLWLSKKMSHILGINSESDSKDFKKKLMVLYVLYLAGSLLAVILIFVIVCCILKRKSFRRAPKRNVDTIMKLY